MAQHPQRQGRRVDRSEREKANSYRGKQNPKRGGGREHIDRREDKLGEHQLCVGRIDFDRTAAPRCSTQRARDHKPDVQGENDCRASA
jgi:hypothetical protein